MRIAILSDIHANREAFEACLTDAARQGAQRFVLLGDLVGYGADPGWVLSRAQEMAAQGAVLIRGNHDEAAADVHNGMTANAAAAMDWTRSVLTEAERDFLHLLPMEVAEEDRLYVHADASAPTRWLYVRDAEEARRSLEGTAARVVISGHVHVPAIFGLTASAQLVIFRPVAEAPVPLTRPRRWLAVVGSVGQPRDGNPAAAWSLLETEAQTLTIHRVPYDIDAAAAKIRAAGLPEALAARLHHGL